MRALGTALALVLTAGLASTSATVPAGTPAAQDPPIVTAADAVSPREGEDYTVLTTLHLPKHGFVDEIGQTGELAIYRDYQRPHIVLLDPESGRRTPLPGAGSGSVLDLTADALWLLEYDRRGYVDGIDRYDRTSTRLRRFTLPEVGRERDANYLHGVYRGRWYFGTGRAIEHETEDLWSLRFGKPRTVRSEGRHKSHPRVVDGRLTWTTFSVDGPSHVVLRDLDTDEVTRWAIPDGCSAAKALRGNGTQLLLDASCDRPEGQTFVLDQHGDVTAILRVNVDEGSSGIVDRGVTFPTHFYDFASGELYDLDVPPLSRRTATSGPGEHPIQVWPREHGELVVRLN